MRLAQLTALLAVWVELRLALGASLDGNWDREESAVIPALLVLLVLGELVRFGRWLSINRLVLLGHFARFTGLGWAGTGFLALLLTWLVPDLADDIGPHVLFWIAGGLAVATSLNAFTIGRTRIVVRKFEIASPNIPEPGDATTAPSILRISVLSDLHLGEFVAATHIRKAVQISNAESPDIVLLLGDYVDRDAALAGVLVDELTRLEAKFGVLAVLGNHDVESTSPQLIVDELDRDPTVALLRNSSTSIEIDSTGITKNLRIIGIESPGEHWSPKSDELGRQVLLGELSKGNSDFTIVVSHHPEMFELSAEHNVDLVVAGHTHGGQLAVPFTGRFLNAGRLVTKYLQGKYESGTTRLVVTAGVGVGIVPARIGVPPEVTLVDIAFK